MLENTLPSLPEISAQNPYVDYEGNLAAFAESLAESESDRWSRGLLVATFFGAVAGIILVPEIIQRDRISPPVYVVGAALGGWLAALIHKE